MILLIPIVVVAALYGILVLRAKPIDDHPFFRHDRPVVIAHRGAAGLWPENTLHAFMHAAELGVDVVEMDVQSTRDGHLVVIHDSTVDRSTNGIGSIKDLALAELQKLDAGYTWSTDRQQTFPFRGQGIRIPTLAEVFTSLPHMGMILEIKSSQPAIAIKLGQMIRRYDMTERVLVASFDAEVMQAFRRLYPEIATSGADKEVRRLYTLHLARLSRVYAPPMESLDVPQYSDDRYIATRRFVKVAHQRNLHVHVWTVNEPEAMQRLLDHGVDGITTDYPDRLLRILSSE
jgi:glycerophosphoryl diester phosphodiesterase